MVYRAAIIGTGRGGSTYDDEIVNRETPAFFRGENRHTGVYTVLPINQAAAFQMTPGFELVAGANRGEAKLRAFGERWGVKALYTDFQTLLRDQRPDIVSVCTRSPEKAEITIAAAEAGAKAIIVTKPLATSMAEADAMIAACDRHGVLFAVHHPYRFSPMIRAAKGLIDGGAIGRLGTVMAHTSGGMLHIGTHTFDLLRFWAGDIVEVDARVPNYEPEKDLPANGLVRFASGVTGFFDHVYGVRQGHEARGTSGSVMLSDAVGDGWLYRTSLLYPGDPRGDPMRLTVEPIEGEPHTMSTLQRLLTELYESLTTGAPLISTGRDGAAAIEAGLACYASHLAGGPITLPLADRSLRVPNR